MRFHAVMLDETRCEFGVDFDADNHDEASDYLQENYPESTCIQLEDSNQSAERERQMYLSILDDDYYPDDYDDE